MTRGRVYAKPDGQGSLWIPSVGNRLLALRELEEKSLNSNRMRIPFKMPNLTIPRKEYRSEKYMN